MVRCDSVLLVARTQCAAVCTPSEGLARGGVPGGPRPVRAGAHRMNMGYVRFSTFT